ncbi:hypothetical protein L0F63_006920, partial [Massospora cicadina]
MRQHTVYVGEYTALRDGNASKKCIKLLVVSNSKLEMSRDNTLLPVIVTRIASKLKYLGHKVDGGTSTDTFGVVSSFKKAAEPGWWKQESRPA